MSNENQLKADGINELVSLMIGAFETGFVSKNNPTLAEIHQVARNHCKDAYGVGLPDIVEQWGEEIAQACGVPSHLLSNGNDDAGECCCGETDKSWTICPLHKHIKE